MKRLFAEMFHALRAAWAYLREVSGDDAYERYVAHCRLHHAGEAPMTREDHHREQQRRKWAGISRCC